MPTDSIAHAHYPSTSHFLMATRATRLRSAACVSSHSCGAPTNDCSGVWSAHRSRRSRTVAARHASVHLCTTIVCVHFTGILLYSNPYNNKKIEPGTRYSGRYSIRLCSKNRRDPTRRLDPRFSPIIFSARNVNYFRRKPRKSPRSILS